MTDPIRIYVYDSCPFCLRVRFIVIQPKLQTPEPRALSPLELRDLSPELCILNAEPEKPAPEYETLNPSS